MSKILILHLVIIVTLVVQCFECVAPEDDEDFDAEGSGLGNEILPTSDSNNSDAKIVDKIFEPPYALNSADRKHFVAKINNKKLIKSLPTPYHGNDNPVNYRFQLTPLIKIYPQTQAVYVSQSAVLRCRDESYLRLPVVWTKSITNKLPIDSYDIKGRLTIPSVKLTDDGEYICKPIDPRYNKYYAVSSLQVNTAKLGNSCPIGSRICPTTRECIQADYFCDGDFDCEDGSDEMDCAPKPCKYDQYRCDNGQCIPAENRCDNQYDCGDRSDERDCAIPTFLNYSGSDGQNSMILREGESLTLNCKASGFPMPNIWWKKNGLRISSSDNGRISNVSEAGVGTLKITNLLTSDAGKYDCVAENTLDSRLSPIQMTVHVRSKDGGMMTGSITPIGQPGPDNIRVIVQPLYLEREKGKTALFECSSNLNGGKIEWRSQRGILPLHSSVIGGQLTIRNISDQDAGIYYCRVMDAFGRAAESRVQLVVRSFGASSPMLVAVSPKYLQVDYSASTRIHCKPSVPARSIEWTFDNGNLPSGVSVNNNFRGPLIETSILTIDKVTQQTAGVYTCFSTTEYGRNTDQSVVELTPRIVPRVNIDVYPASQSVEIGRTARFVCNSTDLRPFQIKWKPIAGGYLPSGVVEQAGSLTFVQVQDGHYGQYTCVLTNSFGTSEKTVSLVRPGQASLDTQVRAHPRKQESPIGGQVRFTCTSSSHKPEELRWTLYRDRQLPQGVESVYGNLIFSSVAAHQFGAYQCLPANEPTGPIVELVQASNYPPRPSDYYPPYPEVPVVPARPEGPLEARIEPEKQTIPQGTTARLSCMITSGDPKSKISWTKVNGQLSERHIIDRRTLRIEQVRLTDRGLYVCNVESPSGATARGSSILEVEPREPPVLKIYPAVRQTISRGGNALFQCRVEGGIPEPTISWSRSDGMPIPPNAQITENGIIKFTRVTGQEAGTYKCVAKNIVGQANYDVVLTIDAGGSPQRDVLPRPSQTGTPNQKVYIMQQNPHRLRAGEPLTLECRSDISSMTMVEWAKYEGGDVRRPLTPRSLLRNIYQLPSATVNDAGIYGCRAYDQEGVGEMRIRVVVHADIPVIEEKFERVQAEEGGFYELLCRAYGPDVTRSVWMQLSGSPNNVRIDGDKFRIEPVSLENSGEFVCYAETARGRTPVRRVKLDVVGRLKMRITPENQTVTIGDTVSVYCFADAGARERAKVSWMRESGSFGPSVEIREGELRFNNIQPSDSGQYLCTGSSSLGAGRAWAHVMVVGGGVSSVTNQPSVHDHRQSSNPSQPRRPVGRRLNVDQQSTHTLKCHFPLLHNYRVEWDFNQRELPSNAKVVDKDLVLSNINKNNEGRYVCNAYIIGRDRPSDRNYYDIVVRDPNSCTGYEWKCTDGTCIDRENHCNQQYDCPDRSDEQYCSENDRRPPVVEDSGQSSPYQRIPTNFIPIPARIDPDKPLVRVGDNITLKCLANTYNPSKTRYQWIKDGSDISRTPLERIEVARDTLKIVEVAPENGGVYTCRVFLDNMLGSAQYVLILHSSNPVTVKFERDIGDSATFDCPREPTRSYYRDYRWEKRENNGTLPENAEYQRYDGRLVIRNINVENAGIYECIYGDTTTGEKRSLLTLSVRLSNETIPSIPALPAS